MKMSTIKTSTRESYLKVVNAAFQHSTAKRTTDWEDPVRVTLCDMVLDLINRQDIAWSTKITSRSALLWYINSGTTRANEDSAQARELLINMRKEPGPRPAQRPKGISETELGLLLDEVYTRADNSVWAKRTAVWILAGLACGARTIEWIDAEWVTTEKTELRLRNAKVKLNKPAFQRSDVNPAIEYDLDDITEFDADTLEEMFGTTDGIFRIIPIDRELDRSIIDTQMRLIRDHLPGIGMNKEADKAAFRRYHNQCRKVLVRASQKVWKGKKTFSLYTMRKQFSANMKAKLGSAATAVLMGHSGEDSPSAASYGKANQAHARFKGLRPQGAPVQRNTSQAKAGQSQNRTPENTGPVE